MKYALTAAALCGLATVSGAQESFLLDFAHAPVSIDGTGDEEITFTVDVIGDASVGTHMLGGSFSIGATGRSQFVDNMTWQSASWDQFPTDGGYAGNGNYNQVIFGQLVIPGLPPFNVPGPGSEVGGVIGTFEITLSGSWDSTDIIHFSLLAAEPFSLEVFDINTSEFYRSSDGDLTLGSFQVGIPPSPGTLPLIGFAGLVASRRRR